MSNEIKRIPDVVQNSDIERLTSVQPGEENPQISEKSGSMLMHVLELKLQLANFMRLIHQQIEKKADSEMLIRLRQTVSDLDQPDISFYLNKIDFISKQLSSKANIEDIKKLQNTITQLDIPTLQPRIKEVEGRVRALIGEKVNRVKTDEQLSSLKINISNLAANNCCKLKGLLTTVGGSTVEEILHPIIEVGMVVIAQISVEGVTPVTIKSTKCEDGKCTITFSNDPADDHVINYIIY